MRWGMALGLLMVGGVAAADVLVPVNLRTLYAEPDGEFSVGVENEGPGMPHFRLTCQASAPCAVDVRPGHSVRLYRGGDVRSVWVAP